MKKIKKINNINGASLVRSYQGGFFKVLISHDQTGGNMALVDMTLPKGVEPPLHVHSREDETFFLIDGVMTFLVGESVIKAEVGDAVFAPRMVPHHFVIESKKARFLTLMTPGNLLDYFMEFSFPTMEEAKINPPQVPPSTEYIENLTKILTDIYGIQLV